MGYDLPPPLSFAADGSVEDEAALSAEGLLQTISVLIEGLQVCAEAECLLGTDNPLSRAWLFAGDAGAVCDPRRAAPQAVAADQHAL